MNSELLNKGRLEYINLNKKFLQLVEDGTSWVELQPLIEEMKSLAVYLQHIPSDTEEVTISSPTNNVRQSANPQDQISHSKVKPRH